MHSFISCGNSDRFQAGKLLVKYKVYPFTKIKTGTVKTVGVADLVLAILASPGYLTFPCFSQDRTWQLVPCEI